MIEGYGAERYFWGFSQPVLEDGSTYMMTVDYLGGGGGGTGTGVSVDLGPVDLQFSGGLPSFGGSGPQQPDVKEQTAQLANAYEAELQRNLAAYQQGRISADQALASAWSLMDQFVSACYRYGQQGALSAAERDRRIDPARLRWDWIGYYIDPISMAATGAPAQAPHPAPVGGAPVGGLPGTGVPVGAGFGLGSQQALMLGALLLAIILLKAKR